MKKQEKVAAYAVSVGVGAIAFLICAATWNLFGQTDFLTIVKILSDCFFLPGVLLVGMALIGWVSSKGTFDIFGYSFRGLVGLFKTESYYQRQESFYDYRTKRDESRKPFNKPLMICGLIFLAIGFVGTVVFLMME